jgi:SH3-like domain-containing protein
MQNYSKLARITLVLISVLTLTTTAIIKNGNTQVRSYLKTQITPISGRNPMPRFVSLRAEKVNMRTGPGIRYPVDWVYRRKNLPVEVIAEFGTWRKIHDAQGGQGWIHQSMLSNRRMFVTVSQMRTIRSKDDSKSDSVAKLERGVVGELKQCPEASGWCKVFVGGYKGWLRRVEFWGVYPREIIR